MSKNSNSFKIGRRGFMSGVAGIAGSALVMPAQQAFAASGGQIVVGTWGGDYAKLLNKNIDVPFLNPAGWEVVQDQAGDPERRAKMLAERRLPRGAADIQALQDSSMYQTFAQDLVEPLDYDQIPNAVHLLPSMRLEYGIPQIFSGMVVLYNPDTMGFVPTSYADVINPDRGDTVGIIDIQYRHNIAVASLIAGGSTSAVEDGKKLLMEVRKSGVRIYPTNEAFAQALQTTEIAGGAMWKARALQWQDAGINVVQVTPTEGFVPYMSGFVMPKNAPNKEGAYAYLNASLEPAAQLNFAIDMGYNPTVDNADLPEDLRERVGFSDEQVANLKPMDFEFFVDNDMELKTWWDQVFKG